MSLSYVPTHKSDDMHSRHIDGLLSTADKISKEAKVSDHKDIILRNGE